MEGLQTSMSKVGMVEAPRTAHKMIMMYEVGLFDFCRKCLARYKFETRDVLF